MATVNLLCAASLMQPDSSHELTEDVKKLIVPSLELRLTMDSPAVTKYLSETLRYMSVVQQQQGWLCFVLC